MANNGFTFWDIMSDAWNYYQDKDMFEQLWDVYGRALYSPQIQLYQADAGKGLASVGVYTRYVWINFTINQSTHISGLTYSLDNESVISIPTLRNGIDEYTADYTNGIDYTHGETTITWLSSVPDSTVLWAPELYKNENRLANNYGILVQEQLPDSSEYLNAINGMFYAYWNGPTARNIRNSLNIFFGLPYVDTDGIVVQQDSTSVTIKRSYNDYVKYEHTADQTSRLEIGDTVQRFDAITDFIEVVDHFSMPNWWDTYAISVINKNIDPDTVNKKQKRAINEYTKHFTFGIRIDGEKYAGLTQVAPGIATRFLDKIRPAYTHYLYTITNDFWSVDQSSTAGEWFEMQPDDGTVGTQLIMLETVTLTYDWIFNYINYITYIDNFDTSNMTFEVYQTTPNRAYDLDGDIIGIYESLEITSS